MVSGKVKVLHVLGGLDRGGVETWLMHVLRHVDRQRFQFDFLVHAERECAYDEEARSLGSRIIPNPDPRNPVRYARNFIRNYRKYGPYDVVHSHVHHYSGFTLLLARLMGVPKRVAHSHSDTRAAETNAGLARKAYLKAMEYLIEKNATHGLAASCEAAACLYGKGWEKDGRWSVLHCGIDLDPFKVETDKKEVRRGLGLPEDAFVIGHVGRFSPQKNHKFLLETASEVFKRCDNCWLLLVGDGPLRPEIEELAESLGIADKVIFAGSRPDV
ncbi:MAG: glycosyltransferase, partial [Actinomycetota bacterium]